MSTSSDVVVPQAPSERSVPTVTSRAMPGVPPLAAAVAAMPVRKVRKKGRKRLNDMRASSIEADAAFARTIGARLERGVCATSQRCLKAINAPWDRSIRAAGADRDRLRLELA